KLKGNDLLNRRDEKVDWFAYSAIWLHFDFKNGVSLSPDYHKKLQIGGCIFQELSFLFYARLSEYFR
ncbi:MAG: hypothetical protein Q3Y21_09330, partial [Bacteroides sp.]|uniref:hypothetical protein n=1 Tax=Bacteroides sp. TaxID=29523 RepID=UPI0028495D6B